MKRLVVALLLICATSIAGAETTGKEWQASGRLTSDITLTNISGGSSADSDREKTTHNEELNLNISGPLWNGESGVETRSRTTNDDRIQKDGVELLYFNSYYRDKIWAVEAGDVAAGLNPYIYSGGLKGIRAAYKSPEERGAWDYTLISGLNKGLWREFYANTTDEAPTAFAGAFEAKYIHDTAKTVSFSIAGLKDDLASVRSNTTVVGSQGFGVGLDGSWRFNRLVTLAGRTALTRGTNDIRNGAPDSYHNAVLLKLLTKPVAPLRSAFTYQRVSTGFVSFGGSGNQDIEQIENATTWDIGSSLTANLNLKASHDNLNGALGATQKNYYEFGQLTYYPAFIKRAEISIHASNKDITGRGADNNQLTAGADFALRSKSGWRYGVGYEFSDYTDGKSSSSSQTTNTCKALLGYKHNLSDDRSYRVTLNANYIGIKDQQDKVGFKIDAGYSHNRKLSMDLLYMTDFIDMRQSDNRTNATYQLRGNYVLDEKGKYVVQLSLEERDIDVDNQPASSYDETIGKISLAMNF